MLLYVMVALICYILLVFSKKTDNNKIKCFLIICSFLILFFVSAIRVNVGTDYKSYYNWFNEVPSFSLRYENFGFNNLIMIIKLFTNNPQWLFVTTSFFILFFVYISVIKEQSSYDISIFLFIALGYYFSTFNGVRQWMASSVFILAYHFAKQKKIVIYILLVIFASLFHKTAILLLPFYIVFQLKINDKIKILLVILSLIIFKFCNFNSLIAIFLKKFSINYYWRYISSGADLTKGVGSIFPVLISGCMLLYYIVFKSLFLERMEKEKYEKRKSLCFILTIFSIINTVNNLFSRFAMYFVPMIILVLPDALIIYNKKYKKLFTILVIIGGLTFMIVNTLLKNSNNPLPYNSIFVG